MLLARVVETIHRYRMFEPGQSVGVAVSGGADSVCLLHVLLELAPRWDLRLTVLHLNHGLRGEESQQDEQFVRELAARLGLAAIVRAVDVAASAGQPGAGRPRRAAWTFFREQSPAGRLARVATGHTRDDQAETVLFRFLRGSGGAGLAAIRPVTAEGMVRPLLGCQPRRGGSSTCASAGSHGVKTPPTPACNSPAIASATSCCPNWRREWNPAIAETLHRAADWALAEEEYWDAEIGRSVAQFLIEREGAVLVRRENSAAIAAGGARRLVRHALERAKGRPPRRGLRPHRRGRLKLASAPVGHGRVQAPGVEVERSLDWLRFVSPAQPRGLPAGIVWPFPCRAWCGFLVPKSRSPWN